jgi:hypothetical protein
MDQSHVRRKGAGALMAAPLPKASYKPLADHPGFILEKAGPMIRLWCDGCDKHTGLPDADPETLRRLAKKHRHGSRLSSWDSPT